MTGSAPLIGLLFGVGVLLAISAWWDPLPASVTTDRMRRRARVETMTLPVWLRWWQIPAAIAAGAVTLLVTRAPAAGVAIGVATMTFPALARGQHDEASFAAKTEATAAWVESLRDAMRGTRGIEGALQSTAETAPPVLRPALTRMNRHIAAGMSMPNALARMADQVNNPVCDLVAAVLVNALDVSAATVPSVLSDVASDARAQAHQHLKIHTSRQKHRTQLRLVGIIVAVSTVLFVALFRSYLAPLNSGSGQAVLSAAAIIVGAMLIWVVALAAVPPHSRVLDPAALMAEDRR